MNKNQQLPTKPGELKLGRLSCLVDSQNDIESQHIAIMQPYLFPYIGYYQLAYHTKKFIFLDDVNFIKKGFINRNFIRLNNQSYRFTLPVIKISQNRLISEHYFLDDASEIINLINYAYKKAPNFRKIMPLITDVIIQNDRNVAKLTARSIESVFDYLGLNCHFIFSSEIHKNNKIKAQNRIIEICNIFNVRTYTNAIGGMNLYDHDMFRSFGINLEFIRMGSINYEAPGYQFIPSLSIIDALMICSVDEVCDLLKKYDLS